MRSKRRKQNIFYKIISAILVISSIIFVGILLYVNLLPTKYLTIIIAALILFDIFNIVLINLKNLKRKAKKFLSVFIILATIFLMIANFYICKTLGILLGNGDSKYKLENYSVLVLKDSNYKKLKDIENETLGYFTNSTGAKEANKKLQKKVDVEFKGYNSSSELVDDLLNSKIEVIIIEDSLKKVLDDENSAILSSTRVLCKITVKVKVESTLKDVDVTNSTFAVYISGIDTYGEIASVSRSDVNIVAVVNPKTKQILIISIPRDYYVQLHGTTGTKDKLTHAGIYGVDMSIKTIEDLLDLEINYYVKVNFTSVIDIVDSLGGLDIYSEQTFISYSGYSFKEGMNSVNGEQALDFVRTRKAFSDGDRQRGRNQQALIEAIIRKASKKAIISKYSSLLNAIDGKYQTNMSFKKMTALIRMQLNDMSSWNITSYSLNGIDSYNYTYTYYQMLYVMEQDKESIDEAKTMIEKVKNGDILENSYEDIGGSSNKVTQVAPSQDTNPKSEPKIQDKKEITYKVSFDTDGGTDIAGQQIKENGLITEPENPKKDGYTFLGWYLNGRKYNFSEKVTKDLVLKAMWQEDEPLEDITPKPDDSDDKESDGDTISDDQDELVE